MFCEWLSTYLYDKNPIPNIDYRLTPAEELNETYKLQGMTFNDIDPEKCDLVSKKYPET